MLHWRAPRATRRAARAAPHAADLPATRRLAPRRASRSVSPARPAGHRYRASRRRRQRRPLVDLLSLVSSTSFHTTPLETVHAAFPHTACGRALVPAVLGGLRVLDGAAQAMESEAYEVRSRPGQCLASVELTTCAFDSQAA